MIEKIKDVMTSEVQTIFPHATAQEAAEKMRSFDVGILPVCEGDKVIGMISDRDIAIKTVAVNHDPRSVPVNEIMTANIYYCYEDADVETAMKLMEDKQIRRLIIIDRNKKLVGIASLGDLAVKTHLDKRSGQVLEKISEPMHS